MTAAAHRLAPALWALALAPVGALTMLLAYRTHPVVPVAAIALLAVVALAYARPVAAVMLAIAAVPLEGLAVPVGGVAVTPMEVVFVLTAFVWAIRRLVEGHLPWAASPLSLPLAALLLATLPGLTVAEQPVAVVQFMVFWGAFVLVAWLLIAEADADSIRTVLWTLAVVGAVLGLVALVTSAGQQELSSTGGVASGRARGAFGSPNILASVLALAFPAALYATFGHRRGRRAPALMAAALILAGLALTLSRGGLLAAAVAMLVMLAWAPLRRFAIVSATLLAALIPFAASPLGQVDQVNVVVQRVESVRYQSSSRTDQRPRIYSETPRMIADHLWTGVGASNYPEFAPRYGIVEPVSNDTFAHAHNIPLTIAAELGIPGLAALVWLLVAVARLIPRACRRGQPARGAGFAVAGALVGVGVQGVFDFTLRSNVMAALVFILLGALAVLARPADPRAA